MNFVNMAFDDDPMTDHPMLTQMPAKKRQKAAGVHSCIDTHKRLQPCYACRWRGILLKLLWCLDLSPRTVCTAHGAGCPCHPPKICQA